MGFALHIRRFIGGSAVHPQRDRDPGLLQRQQIGDAAAQPAIALRTMSNAGSGAAQQGNLLRQKLHQMGKPHVISQPVVLRAELHRRHGEFLPRGVKIIDGFR